jgi:membrane fusion protein (multidrug efflux system)
MKQTDWIKAAICAVWMVSHTLVACAEQPEPATEVAVEVGKVVKTTLHRYVSAYGMVEPEPATFGKPPASSKIAALAAGIVTQIHCEEGQRVKKGAPLFTLDSRAADALVAKAEVAVEFAQKNFVRKQQMLPAENVSRKLYDEAEQALETARKDLTNAQTQRALLRIDAPLTGTVAAIYSKIGEAVGPNTVLADLIDLDRLVVGIRVPSQEASWLHLGQPVDISAGSLLAGSAPDTQAKQRGTLLFISPQVDPRTDTVLARISLDIKKPLAPGGRAKRGAGVGERGVGLRPGQFVSVRIVVEERPARLAVPVESVVSREGNAVIAVVEGDRAKQKPVKTGLRDGGLVEVEGEDLREGMGIVTQGVYGLPVESRIRVVK